MELGLGVLVLEKWQTSLYVGIDFLVELFQGSTLVGCAHMLFRLRGVGESCLLGCCRRSIGVAEDVGKQKHAVSAAEQGLAFLGVEVTAATKIIDGFQRLVGSSDSLVHTLPYLLRRFCLGDISNILPGVGFAVKLATVVPPGDFIVIAVV